MEKITVSNLTFTYAGAASSALHGIDLEIRRGEFLTLCGPSGSGKSTFLRLLKPLTAPSGAASGGVFFDGAPATALSAREQAEGIGFILQNPENQIVTDKVWHELAFGLESLGFSNAVIRRRVAEMSSFFGIDEWFYKSVSELSGGQRQLLNLASVMAMQPSILLLDEPTSQLDPIAAEEFLAVLGKINRELGTTIVIVEHRLGEVFPLSSRVAVFEGGSLLCTGSPREVGRALQKAEHGMFLALPAPMRAWAAVGGEGECPVSVSQGREWFLEYAESHKLYPERIPKTPARAGASCAIRAKDLWFRYERGGADVLKGLSFEVRRGEIFAIVGGNGAGKTTAMGALAGLHKPYRGKAELFGRAALLPQNPQSLFVKGTVQEDFDEMRRLLGQSREEFEKKLCDVVSLCRLEGLLERHPYDLSGGEQQRAAMVKLLLTDPDILLLDEPTKGIDAQYKKDLGLILKDLAQAEKTIVLVSHDVEFCAEMAERCAMLFQGELIAEEPAREFFCGNQFYTTAINRMAGERLPEVLTVSDFAAACDAAEVSVEKGGGTPRPPQPPEADLEAYSYAPEVGADSGRLSFSAKVAILCLFLMIPLTIFVGFFVLDGRNYYIMSVLIMLEAMLPFYLAFEGRKPRAREIVLLASLCALIIASRAAFYPLPNFKPVAALVIICAVALGAETGFLLGASSMLVSNIMFGQGPWTPFQMFAMGLIGFLAGALARGKVLTGRRLPLVMFGAISVIVIYGGIMNPASALMWLGEINLPILISYYITGFPMDCVHAAATVLVLWYATKPMLQKLERVKMKYGMFLGHAAGG